jgi:hypothetical protein
MLSVFIVTVFIVTVPPLDLLLQVDELKAVSSSDAPDCSIKLWELQPPHLGRCIRTINLLSVARTLAIPSPLLLLAGCEDGSTRCYFFGSAAAQMEEERASDPRRTRKRREKQQKHARKWVGI